MALRFRIRQLMVEKEELTGEKETYRKIFAKTHISPNTLSGLSTGRSKQVGVGTIDRLLEYFDCGPEELITRKVGT